MGLILNMSLADFLTGIFICAYNAYIYIKDGGALLHQKWVCHWVNVLSIILIGQSIYTNLLLSCERYISICHPFKYQLWITKARMITTLVIGWIYMVVGGSIGFITEANNWNHTIPVCTPKVLYPFPFIMFIYGHIVTLLSTNVVLQMLVAKQVIVQHRRIRQLPCQEDTFNQKREIKKGKMTMLIFLAFIACWSLHLLISPINVYVNSNILLVVREVGFTFGVFNSFINCIIYIMKNRILRQSVKKMFGIKTSSFKFENSENCWTS